MEDGIGGKWLIFYKMLSQLFIYYTFRMYENQLSWKQMSLFFFLIVYFKVQSLTLLLCMCLTDIETYKSLAFSLVFSLYEKW